MSNESIRHSIEGDVDAAFRDWLERQADEHERRQIHFLEELCHDGRPAVATHAALATLELVWTLLAPLRHPTAVVGGLSLAAWNHIRATRDVDLLIGIEWNEIDSLLATLVPTGFRSKKSSAIGTVFPKFVDARCLLAQPPNC